MKKQSLHKKKTVKRKKSKAATSKYHKKIKIDASFEEVIKLAAQDGFVQNNK